ncbi:MAB_1171c family putative transporter [Streptomyces sp. NPDC002490]|uniref:MAB_1171c family putative transporter n=1 Tax=Streptomyces sp. NPDC002490 TaxID=3154416 RepID=UPI00332A3150
MTSGPGNLVYFSSGLVLLLACAVKVPALIRRPDNALLRAACRLLLAGGCIMFLAAPQTIVALNRWSGITNLSAPVVYATLTAYSGSSLLLIIHWRPAPPEQTRRLARWCVIAYALAVAAVFLLFWAGDAPVEQVTLFDAHYANTPFIREMIVTYLVAHGVAAIANVVLCWRWSKQIRGSLRAGLRLLVVAYLLHLCYDGTRLVAVAARWTGRDLDFLVDEVSPRFVAASAFIGAIGFTLPLFGPRLAAAARAVHQLRQLAPLNRALRNVSAPGAVRSLLPWWRTSPAVLLTSRKTALYDAVLALAPYCDRALREAVYRAALRSGDREPSAAAAADAAMIMAARERQRAAPDRLPDHPPPAAWQAPDLIPISLALASPHLKSLHEHHRAPTESSAS